MKNFRSIFISSLGNIIEWYDFGLFTIFSPLFSRLFFPAENANNALIATFGIFAVGFICRPIGAMLFGYLGDTRGRAKSLRLSILLITIPTLLIGCIPSYERIGVWAPILLVMIRMLQGLSIGGEYTGNIVYLAENAPKKNRGIVTAFASAGANVGILLATFMGIVTSFLFTVEQLESWGWRLAYLISGIFCIYLYITRLNIPETQVFNQLKQQKELVENPLHIVFKKQLLPLLRTLGLVCMGTTFYYFSFIYIPVFLQESKHLSISYVAELMSMMICLMIILIPLAGKLCDRFGRRKMLLLNASLITLGVIPGFYLLQQTYYFIALVLMCFTLFSSLEQGTTSIALVENFPPPARYTGISIGYNIGNGLLGGTVPMISEWLLTTSHMQMMPAIYIAFCALITGLVVWFFVPETKTIALAQVH